MAEHVAGLGGYEVLGFEDVVLGCVLAFEGFELFGGVVAEHVLEELVERAFVGYRGAGGAALIEDFDGGAVGFGLANRVTVYEGTEDLLRGLAVFDHDRGSGEADPGGVRKSLPQVGVEGARLGAVGLVHQEQYVFGGVQLGVEIVPFALLDLLHHGEDEVRALLPQDGLEIFGVRGASQGLPDEGGGLASCFSRSVRSVTTTILKRRSAGMVRI